MVTIPVEYRAQLGIEPNSLMEATLVDGGILFKKVEYGAEKMEIYSDSQIARFLKEDKLDKKTVDRLKKLMS